MEYVVIMFEDDNNEFVAIVPDIPYAKLAKDTQLGQDIYMLSYNGLLLRGIAATTKPKQDYFKY